MLAPNKILSCEDFTYPLLASIKMDGIRALIINGGLYSRSGKAIPSASIQYYMLPLVRWCNHHQLVLDGELWAPETAFQKITSIVMSKVSIDTDYTKIGFHAFDALTFAEWENKQSTPFIERNARLIHIPNPGIHVMQWVTESATELAGQYEAALEEGLEGLIVRSAAGKYKWGRCTVKENNIFKLKNVEEIDAMIIGWYERMAMLDNIEREEDAFGRDKPVHRQENLIEAGDLGSLAVIDELGREFSVGSGFTAAERHILWQDRTGLIGRWVKVKYATAGIKDLPRHPVFVSFRDAK